jgi:hypothetical protein
MKRPIAFQANSNYEIDHVEAVGSDISKKIFGMTSKNDMSSSIGTRWKNSNRPSPKNRSTRLRDDDVTKISKSQIKTKLNKKEKNTFFLLKINKNPRKVTQ